jgi:hypothetical protein
MRERSALVSTARRCAAGEALTSSALAVAGAEDGAGAGAVGRAGAAPAACEATGFSFSLLRCRLRAVVDLRQRLVELHDVPFVDEALLQNAAGDRRDFDGDLVGLELDEGIPWRDGITFVLQPLRDRRFDNRLSERWHFDRCHR